MKAWHLLIILSLGIILTLPVLIYGIPFLSDDGVLHALWYTHFSEQLWSGDFYPRWLINMNGGMGSPVFFYYPPVPYFLTSILKPFFSSDPHGWHQLGISTCFSMIASGICAYLWLSKTTDQTPALIAAILYMAMPYHLAADLYVRGAFAEYWTFVWIPLILFFAHKTIHADRFAAVSLAVSYALLIMTHLPTTLIFSIILICYPLFIADARSKAKALGRTLWSLLLGIGLSAIYLLPAMSTQQFVFLNRMTTGYFSYRNWLLFSNFSLWRDDKIAIILLVLDMVAIDCCAFLIIRSSADTRLKKISAFWFTVSIVSIFMMTKLSEPIWWIVPVLQKIQFPSRFNVVVAVSSAILLAAAISTMKGSQSSPTRLIKTIALLLILAWVPATGWAAWNAFSFTNPDQDAINDEIGKIEQRRDAPEYRPRWSSSMAELDWEASIDIDHWDALLKKEFELLLHKATDSEGALNRVSILKGSGQVEIINWKPREIGLHVVTTTGVLLNVSQFYYPGWEAHLIEAHRIKDTVGLTLKPSAPDGLLSLDVPAGDYQIELQLKHTKAEIIGQLISALSLIITVCLILYPFTERYYKRGKSAMSFSTARSHE